MYPPCVFRLCSDESEGEEGSSSSGQQGLDDLDNKCFAPVEVPEAEHRLQSQYCLWYSRRKVVSTESHSSVEKFDC